AYYSSAGGYHGFLYNPNSSTYTTLDDPLATGAMFNKGTFAYGINNSGQIVGSYANNIGSGIHGFVYSGGSYITLDDPWAETHNAGLGTVASGINDAGQIAGFYYDFGAHPHGFLYSGGVYTTLDDPLA